MAKKEQDNKPKGRYKKLEEELEKNVETFELDEDSFKELVGNFLPKDLSLVKQIAKKHNYIVTEKPRRIQLTKIK